VPEPRAAALCVLALRLPDGSPALTVLNFGQQEVTEEIDLAPLAKGKDDLTRREWRDALPSPEVTVASKGGRLRVRLPGLWGTTFVGKKGG
jgi:hypothetical protein